MQSAQGARRAGTLAGLQRVWRVGKWPLLLHMQVSGSSLSSIPRQTNVLQSRNERRLKKLLDKSFKTQTSIQVTFHQKVKKHFNFYFYSKTLTQFHLFISFLTFTFNYNKLTAKVTIQGLFVRLFIVCL